MEEFLKLYEKVFNENNNIKICGRQNCINLIEAAQKIEPNIDFGNVKTGFMNTQNLKNLKENKF